MRGVRWGGKVRWQVRGHSKRACTASVRRCECAQQCRPAAPLPASLEEEEEEEEEEEQQQQQALAPACLERRRLHAEGAAAA